MGIFLAIVIAFALGAVFGGAVGWTRGDSGRPFLFWRRKL
jgi:hypothetical protein